MGIREDREGDGVVTKQFAAESWREEFTALRRQRLSADHPLGNLPLRVLERAKDTNEFRHAQQI